LIRNIDNAYLAFLENRLFRACCAHAEELREPFESPIESDETTIGGTRHGKRGWGAAGKVIVLGILQRNGQVKVFAVPAREGKERSGWSVVTPSPVVSTTPMTGKHTVRCASRETT